MKYFMKIVVTLLSLIKSPTKLLHSVEERLCFQFIFLDNEISGFKGKKKKKKKQRSLIKIQEYIYLNIIKLLYIIELWSEKCH